MNGRTRVEAPAPDRSPPDRPASLPLPPPGPGWFGAVMGTAILGTLSFLHRDAVPGGGGLAVVFLVAAWGLTLGLSTVFLARCVRDRGLWRDSWEFPARAPLWGMASMGYLATGSATATVASGLWPRWGSVAWSVDGLMWLVGTGLGLGTALGFVRALRAGRAGEESFVRGLAVVPPMVSSTTGAALVPHLPADAPRWVLTVVAASFFLGALALGIRVFGGAYREFWLRCGALPLPASASCWIPLGMVGQSTAAAQTIDLAVRSAAGAGSGTADGGPLARDVVPALAHGYGYVALAVGVPLGAWAVWTTARAFARRMPFSPGWWAMTFPVGTCCLGATLLGRAVGSSGLETAGLVLLCCLYGTWTLCTVASTAAIAGVFRTVVPRRG